jgi:hypothetical protein
MTAASKAAQLQCGAVSRFSGKKMKGDLVASSAYVSIRQKMKKKMKKMKDYLVASAKQGSRGTSRLRSCSRTAPLALTSADVC